MLPVNRLPSLSYLVKDSNLNPPLKVAPLSVTTDHSAAFVGSVEFKQGLLSVWPCLQPKTTSVYRHIIVEA